MAFAPARAEAFKRAKEPDRLLASPATTRGILFHSRRWARGPNRPRALSLRVGALEHRPIWGAQGGSFRPCTRFVCRHSYVRRLHFRSARSRSPAISACHALIRCLAWLIRRCSVFSSQGHLLPSHPQPGRRSDEETRWCPQNGSMGSVIGRRSSERACVLSRMMSRLGMRRRTSCTPKGRCLIGWILVDSGRTSFDVWLDIYTDEGRSRRHETEGSACVAGALPAAPFPLPSRRLHPKWALLSPLR